ncbi:AAA family ATPase [Pedococcus sp. KACC 23699]|uniref:AAA family ATPase n=1 Tax=Pedococcus sp. KACC 23699 TaxID=3149228 RepID=A0AAU7JSF2_9MICO
MTEPSADVAGAAQPAVLPPAAAAEVRETHSAVVLLCGEFAYKVKKPVDLGFLDFSTAERRRAACHRELVLNRRMTPDVYVEVLDLVDEQGTARDHVLVMRRMPDDRRLSTLVRQGSDVTEAVRQLARQVASFHSSARTNAQISECGSPEALEQRWRSNTEALRQLAPSGVPTATIAEVERLCAAYVSGRRALLEDRMRTGRVRDGHGDLLADDIFLLPQGPRVLDCLDFDDTLRWMDVVDDLASLVMDLERLGAAPVAAQLVRDYHEFSGAVEPSSLAHHYVAYRAVMRCKIAAIRESTSTGAARDAAAREAAVLAAIGVRHLRAGVPRLVLVGGAPGTGKSTTADRLGELLSVGVLSADRVRKELAGLSPDVHHPEPYGVGLYSQESTDATYRSLAAKARYLVGRGETVVVDASFSTVAQRDLFHAVGSDLRSPVVGLECAAPREVVAARLRGREHVPSQYSDADLDVGMKLAGARQAWPSAVTVDTTASPELTARRAAETVSGAVAETVSGAVGS